MRFRMADGRAGVVWVIGVNAGSRPGSGQENRPVVGVRQPVRINAGPGHSIRGL